MKYIFITGGVVSSLGKGILTSSLGAILRGRGYRVTAVNGDLVTLDANPKWAGKTLEYSITIHAVREAEPEELEHGHVHGEGGVRH